MADQKLKTKKPATLVNPCSCWSLKDGCIVVGIWTVICALLQLALYGWQTGVVREERFRSSNSRAQWYGTLSRHDERYPAYYEQYYETPEERFFLQLFIVQIIHVISTTFLLGSGIALIYAVQRRVKFAFWPYYVTVVVNILANIAYCGIWLSSPPAPSQAAKLSTSLSVRDRIPYWAVITAVAIIFSLINIFCFVVIVAGHRHVSRGMLGAIGYRLEPRPHGMTPKTSAVSISHDDFGNKTETKVIPDDVKKEMNQVGMGTPGSIRKPMDPNLLAGYPQYPTMGYTPPQQQGFVQQTGISPPQPGYPGAYPQGAGYPFHQAASYPYYPGVNPSMTPGQMHPTPDVVPPYRPHGTPQTDVKQQFTQLWLNGVEPGNTVDPAPIVVGPPTQSVLGGSKVRRSKRKRHGSRSSVRSRGSTRSRSRRRSRGSESDTTESSLDDYETRSRTSVRTCDSCRRRLKYGDEDARKKHRGHKRRNSDSSISDTGYSDFTRSRTTGRRHSGSESDTATSYFTQVTESRRSGRSRRSQSDDDRRHRRRKERVSPPKARPAKGDTGYTSAPAGVGEAKDQQARDSPQRADSQKRQPVTGGAAGGAMITIPITIPTPPRPATGSGSSFSEQSTLPVGARPKPAGGSATPPKSGQEYQVESEVTIQYTSGDGRVITTTTDPSRQNKPAAAPFIPPKPVGGVPLPGMARKPTPPDQPQETKPDPNTSSSSNATRTYGTTAV